MAKMAKNYFFRKFSMIFDFVYKNVKKICLKSTKFFYKGVCKELFRPYTSSAKNTSNPIHGGPQTIPGQTSSGSSPPHNKCVKTQCGHDSLIKFTLKI